MRKLLRSCEAVKPFRIEFCLCIESDFANQKRNRAIRCIMRFLEVTNPICYHVKISCKCCYLRKDFVALAKITALATNTCHGFC